MNGIAVLWLLAPALLAHCSLADLDLKSCGSNDAIQVEELRISPYPISISQNLKISTSIKVTRALRDNVSAHLKISIDSPAGPFPLPCVETENGERLGSCVYDVCSLLKTTIGRDFSSTASCGDYLDNLGYPCTCPIPEGNYTFTEATVALSLPSALETILTMMDAIVIRVEIKDNRSNETLMCKELSLDSFTT